MEWAFNLWTGFNVLQRHSSWNIVLISFTKLQLLKHHVEIFSLSVKFSLNITPSLNKSVSATTMASRSFLKIRITRDGVTVGRNIFNFLSRSIQSTTDSKSENFERRKFFKINKFFFTFEWKSTVKKSSFDNRCDVFWRKTVIFTTKKMIQIWTFTWNDDRSSSILKKNKNLFFSFLNLKKCSTPSGSSFFVSCFSTVLIIECGAFIRFWVSIGDWKNQNFSLGQRKFIERPLDAMQKN